VQIVMACVTTLIEALCNSEDRKAAFGTHLPAA
jgi:hypothetical protein